MTNGSDVTVSIISTAGGILTLLLGGKGAQVLVRRNQVKAKKAATAPVPVQAPATPTEQQEFLRTVMEDNTDLRRRLKAIEDTVRQMQEDQDFVHQREQSFTAALGRWLSRIYRGWPQGGNPFPMPEGADLQTLQEIIPRG